MSSRVFDARMSLDWLAPDVSHLATIFGAAPRQHSIDIVTRLRSADVSWLTGTRRFTSGYHLRCRSQQHSIHLVARLRRADVFWLTRTRCFTSGYHLRCRSAATFNRWSRYHVSRLA